NDKTVWMVTLAKPQIANFLLARQDFNSSRSMMQVLEDLSCIQVDPINVVSRAHELALYNRSISFQKSELYQGLYVDHTLFEYWMQLYSIIPISAYPYLKAIKEVPGDRQREVGISWQIEYRKQHQQELGATLEYIREHGPTTGKNL